MINLHIFIKLNKKLLLQYCEIFTFCISFILNFSYDFLIFDSKSGKLIVFYII